VDYSAAFDKVWHLGLIRKMSRTVPGRFTRFTRSFLTNRLFKVRIGTSLSRTNVQKNGTPQGSCLSPMLFLLYTADLPDHIRSTSDSIRIGIYADDVAVWSRSSIIAETQADVQKALDAIAVWSKLNYMSINPTKSEGILFTPSTREHKTVLDLKINDIPIRTPDTITYLGITFDKGMFFHKHAKILSDSISQRTRALSLLAGQNWGITSDDLSHLHTSFVLPKMRYSLSAFGAHLSNASKKKLDTAILKGCRLSTGLYSGSPNDAVWIESRATTVDTEIRRAVL
jgi:hypothetical protein